MDYIVVNVNCIFFPPLELYSEGKILTSMVTEEW